VEGRQSRIEENPQVHNDHPSQGNHRESVLDMFRKCGALLQGHFVLSSGSHSDRYFQCALLFDDPRLGRSLAQALADKIRRQLGNRRIDRVVGPAMGGIIIGHEVAHALGVRSCFTERVGKRMALRRGFEVRAGERVLIVEDVVTTGGSAGETASVMRELGAKVEGVACIVDRTQDSRDAPLVSLIKVQVTTWDVNECPLCHQGQAVVKPGSR